MHTVKKKFPGVNPGEDGDFITPMEPVTTTESESGVTEEFSSDLLKSEVS